MERSKIIAVDVDATIWDFHEQVIKVLKDNGHEIEYHDIAHWDYAQTAFGYDTSRQAYEQVLDPEMVPHRELYPGVRRALLKLKDRGYHIVFMTHNDNPHEYHRVLYPWLVDKFGECELHVDRESESKVEKLVSMGGLGIIDDKPKTLQEAVDAKLWAATVLHPWNRDVVKKNRGKILGFKDWKTFQRKVGLVDPV